jgi:peptidyl-prolyl cis-trans isomerase B (cyclophilin B)
MPSRKQTRERQLAKLAARRAAERRKKRRQRLTAAGVGIVVALGGFLFVIVALTGGSKKPLASPSATPTATATAPSPSPSTGPAGVACGGEVPKAASVQKKQYPKAPKMTIDTTKKYLMTMVTSCGTIKLELDPGQAPNTVNSLVFLANQKYFDGLTFHRIVKNFVIQGGDPLGTGTGGPGYKTVDPPPQGVKYGLGDLAMAKAQSEPSGTAGSQFFIVTGDPRPLDTAGSYALVGHVIAGQAVAKRIESLPGVGDAQDAAPAQTVYIEKVTVEVKK